MKVLVASVSIIGSVLLRGVTLAVLWSWFIAGPEAPFSGLPELEIVEAIGVSLVVWLLTHQLKLDSSYESKGSGELLVEGILTELLYNGFLWVMAIVVHAMM